MDNSEHELINDFFNSCIIEKGENCAKNTATMSLTDDGDVDFYEKSVEYVVRTRFISVAIIMSRWNLDREAAAEIYMKMQKEGIIEETECNLVSEAIISREEWESRKGSV